MAPKYQDRENHVKFIVDAAVRAADPGNAVSAHLRRDGDRIHLGTKVINAKKGAIYLISVGKAAVDMGRTAAAILGDYLTHGIIITKHNQLVSPAEAKVESWSERIQLFGAGHPISDEASLSATEAVAKMLEPTTEDDLVLCLISGGTSSLLTQPTINLSQWQLLVDRLLASGCTINELNSVRKRLDKVKGGGLATMASPAHCVSLILSDVIGNPLDMIGSGPTTRNPDTPGQALEILDRYGIREIMPGNVWLSVMAALERAGSKQDELETVAENIIVGDVRQAAEAAVDAALTLGFDASLLSAFIEGEARDVGKVAAAIAKESSELSALVLGGETTVTVRGSGKGGRNQELALGAAIALEGWSGRVVAGFATDGDDGPTDAAGAIATGDTVSQAHFAGINPVIYLDNNDSYSFFREIGGLIVTGPTGTNVNDLVLILNYDA